MALTLPSNESVRTAVEAGTSVTVLSSYVVTPATRVKTLNALPFRLPDRPFFVLRHKERFRRKAADALLALIEKQQNMTSNRIFEIISGLRPLSNLSHPREMIRQFTPNWFAATMGTGILAMALAQFPYAIPGLKQIGETLWVFNIGLFTLFSILYAARWIMFTQEASQIFGHSMVSMFIGTIPMGLATIMNGLIAFGLPRLGAGVIPIAEALWWIDVVMAIVCGVTIPFLMFTIQDHSIDQMTQCGCCR